MYICHLDFFLDLNIAAFVNSRFVCFKKIGFAETSLDPERAGKRMHCENERRSCGDRFWYLSTCQNMVANKKYFYCFEDLFIFM